MKPAFTQGRVQKVKKLQRGAEEMSGVYQVGRLICSRDLESCEEEQICGVRKLEQMGSMLGVRSVIFNRHHESMGKNVSVFRNLYTLHKENLLN